MDSCQTLYKFVNDGLTTFLKDYAIVIIWGVVGSVEDSGLGEAGREIPESVELSHKINK